MSKYIFDPETNAFYPIALKDDYVAAGIWPSKGVECDEDVFSKFSSTPAEGKIRVVGDDGLPAWGEVPAPTQAQLIENANAEKKSLLSEANSYTQPWQTQLMLGIISDADKASLTIWMKYYQQVQAVDTSTAPDITWPTKPA